MFELYVIIGVSALILGLIGYIKFLYARNTAVKAELKAAEQLAESQQTTIEQTSKIANAVREVSAQRREKQIADQAQIDSHGPRNHFETQDF